MERSIEISRKCRSEPGKISPKVGAIVMTPSGTILGEAYRGELRPGDHAEYTLFERKLKGVDLKGCTLFTTLEPCTIRSPDKTPCLQRTLDRQISTVYIGTLDPNKNIRGDGELRLQEAGIKVLRYGDGMADIIRRLNADFWHKHRLPKNVIRTSNDEVSKGPNGFSVGHNEEGDLVEWITDDEESGEPFGMILRRNDDTIRAMYNECWDKVWWNRHKCWIERLESGEETLDPKQVPLLDRAKDAAVKIEEKYGLENLGWNDVDWGILQGKLSATAWIMGSEWEESLDT